MDRQHWTILRDTKIGIDQMTDAEREELWKKLFARKRNYIVVLDNGKLVPPTDEQFKEDLARMGRWLMEAICLAIRNDLPLRAETMTENRAAVLRNLLAAAKHSYYEAETEPDKAFAAADVEALTAACYDLGLIDDHIAFEVNGLRKPGDEEGRRE